MVSQRSSTGGPRSKLDLAHVIKIAVALQMLSFLLCPIGPVAAGEGGGGEEGHQGEG